jgi:hypothetical protein
VGWFGPNAPRGVKVLKFNCWAPDAEVRGVIVADPGPNGDFDVLPDANYRHMAFAPLWPTVHCEQYPTILDANGPLGGCSENPEWNQRNTRLPQVRDLVTGVARPAKKNDHVRVVGGWTPDNDLHRVEVDQRPELETSIQGLALQSIKTEFHPYFPTEVRMIPALAPGDVAAERLSVCAPVYTQVYSDTSWWNRLWDYDRRVFPPSVREVVSVTWEIDAPPLPDGAVAGVTHQLTPVEIARIVPPPGAFIEHQTHLDGTRLWVSVTITGQDVLNPSRFVADYRLEWRSLHPAPPPPAPVPLHHRLTWQGSPNPIPPGVPVDLTVDALDPAGKAVSGARVGISNPGWRAGDPYPKDAEFDCGVSIAGYVFRPRSRVVHVPGGDVQVVWEMPSGELVPPSASFRGTSFEFPIERTEN